MKPQVLVVLLLLLLLQFLFCFAVHASEGDELRKSQELLEKIRGMPAGSVPEALLNEASEHLKRAIAENPDAAKTRTDMTANLGQYFQNAGNAQASLFWWRKTVELDNSDWRAWAKIVQCCQALNDAPGREEAKKHIVDLYKAGKVEQELFCVDQFSIGDDRVMVLQYLKPSNENIKVSYSFNIFAKENLRAARLRYTLAELPIDTEIARATKKIGANAHAYSLDRYDHGVQSLIGMYYGEKPTDYDQVKKAVLADIPKSRQDHERIVSASKRVQSEQEEKKKEALKMASQMAGFDEAAKLFSITDSNIGNVNSQPESLFLQLEIRNPKAISSIWWWNHLSGKKPSASWNDMLRLYKGSEELVKAQAWLLKWKAQDGNALECHIAGTKCYSAPDTDIKDYVLPAWRDAKLQGEPTTEILLRRHDQWCGTIYLSAAEKNALVLNAKKGAGSHWLDKQDLAFHPKKPNYLLVHPDGVFEERKMDPNSPLLPAWARSK